MGIVYFSAMAALVEGLRLHVQAALVTAYAIALAVHFSLNRRYVFSSGSGYALSLSAQGARYTAVALASYALTSVALAVLPTLLGTTELLVFYAVAPAQTAVTFLVLRRWIFAGRVSVRVPEVAVEAGRGDAQA